MYDGILSNWQSALQHWLPDRDLDRTSIFQIIWIRHNNRTVGGDGVNYAGNVTQPVKSTILLMIRHINLSFFLLSNFISCFAYLQVDLFQRAKVRKWRMQPTKSVLKEDVLLISTIIDSFV